MYYQNVRGLRTKCKDFYLSSTASNFDIIALSETWLNPSFHDHELFHTDFNVYRCDRSTQTSVSSRGRGVLISVKKTFQSEQLHIPSSETFEVVFVKVTLDINLFFCCLYIPPSSEANFYERLTSVFEIFLNQVQLQFEDIIVICGDFNSPTVEWVNDCDNISILLPFYANASCPHSLFNMLLSNGLNQLNFVKNFQNRLLDLLFTSSADLISISESSSSLVPIDAYHKPFVCKIIINDVSYVNVPSIEYYNFHRANYCGINNFLSSVD